MSSKDRQADEGPEPSDLLSLWLSGMTTKDHPTGRHVGGDAPEESLDAPQDDADVLASGPAAPQPADLDYDDEDEAWLDEPDPTPAPTPQPVTDAFATPVVDETQHFDPDFLDAGVAGGPEPLIDPEEDPAELPESAMVGGTSTVTDEGMVEEPAEDVAADPHDEPATDPAQLAFFGEQPEAAEPLSDPHEQPAADPAAAADAEWVEADYREWYDENGLRWYSEDGGFVWYADDGQIWNAETGELLREATIGPDGQPLAAEPALDDEPTDDALVSTPDPVLVDEPEPVAPPEPVEPPEAVAPTPEPDPQPERGTLAAALAMARAATLRGDHTRDPELAARADRRQQEIEAWRAEQQAALQTQSARLGATEEPAPPVDVPEEAEAPTRRTGDADFPSYQAAPPPEEPAVEAAPAAEPPATTSRRKGLRRGRSKPAAVPTDEIAEPAAAAPPAAAELAPQPPAMLEDTPVPAALAGRASRKPKRAATAQDRPIPERVEFRPRALVRTLLGVVCALAVLGAIAAIVWAATTNNQASVGLAVGVAGIALACWWLLLSWNPTTVAFRGAKLEVSRGTEGERFDLLDPALDIEVGDDPASRTWRTTIVRPNNSVLIIPATSVDAEEFTRLVNHYRSGLSQP